MILRQSNHLKPKCNQSESLQIRLSGRCNHCNHCNRGLTHMLLYITHISALVCESIHICFLYRENPGKSGYSGYISCEPA